jgi:hexosaminidase
MKSFFVAIAVSLYLVSLTFAQTNEINIIPRPQRVLARTGTFTITPNTRIVVGSGQPHLRKFAAKLNERLFASYGFKLRISSQNLKKDFISFGESTYNDPSPYMLEVSDSSIKFAGRENGMFYALQSLFQLLPAGRSKTLNIPGVVIIDAPRFRYRGMHLDVARHFQSVEFVKKFIDLMAQYKFNYFHWHLTDDQGWRIEIKKYPRLTEVGSKRRETHLGAYTTTFKGDGIPHSGFYTQEQIKDVVRYAKERYITVIPEIEMPGHASAALAAYPQFGCKENYQYKVQMTWGIFKEVFCPTDATFRFLEDVLDETIKLFPDSPYIHIGGDEVLKDHWKESPFVQELKQKENLKDEHEVQSYFIRRIEKFINSKGKKIIGWDEILEGGVAPNATIMSWRGEKGGIEAAHAKHDVIMTPNTYVYFDYSQGDPAYEPLNIGGYVPLETVYSFDPVPKDLRADESKYILGGQANIWTEYLKTPRAVEYMAYPRMLALSEVLWSPPENKNFADFLGRLSSHLSRLDRQNVNYRIPEPLGLENAVVPKGGALGMEVRSLVPGSKVLGTVDGRDPTESSPLFPSRFVANPGEGKMITVKTIVVLKSGRKSSIYTTTFIKRDYLQPVELADKRPGVIFALYNPSVLDASPIRGGETKSIGLSQLFAPGRVPKLPFSAAFDAYFKAPTDDIYEFQVDSTWDATLVVGSEKLIDENGTNDHKIRTAIVPLKAGFHKISLMYNHRGGEPVFNVRWAIKGQNWRGLGEGELVH